MPSESALPTMKPIRPKTTAFRIDAQKMSSARTRA
jgi:hypothetical protein